jgi:hypothetical protein
MNKLFKGKYQTGNLEAGDKESGLIKWIKRLGFIGFLFFLIKGLLWIIIPYLIAAHFIE